MKIFLVILAVFLFFAAAGSGSVLSFLTLGAISVFVFVRALKLKPSSDKEKQARSPQEKQARAPKGQRAPQVKAPKIAPAGVAENAARRLREIATAFENQSNDAFFVMHNLFVTRNTQSQSIRGPGAFQISRSGITVVFVNANSRNPTQKQITKKWNQIIGVTPNSFEIYFQDHSSFEFQPANAEDHLVFSAFWQTFNDALNGLHILIENPKQSGLANRLRTVAQYVDTHRAECSNGALNVEDILDDDIPYVEEPEAQKYSPLKVGDVVDGWKLVRQLGNGGFGTVFLAQEQKDPQNVAAIKTMRVPSEVKVGTPLFHRHADLFAEEATRSFNFFAAAYVLTAQDEGKTPWPWIRYPLMQGGTLESLVMSERISRQQWWNLAHDLLSGLDSIHSEGLVHKDIKPDNIMLAGDRFVILDLGISVVDGFEQLAPGRYLQLIMAPEVLNEASEKSFPTSSFTPKVDVFAAGMTLYWCLTGDFPWPASEVRTSSQQRLAQLRTQPVDYSHCPPETIPLLHKMLELDPKKRANARSLLFDVLPHIDIELKTIQVESAARETFSDGMGNEEVEQHGEFNNTITGPFATWSEFDQEIRRVVSEVRPSFFAIDIEFLDGREFTYVQGLSGAGGWILECMSEKFSETQHALEMKARFMSLGWDPPTSSSPNYERDLEGYSADDVSTLLLTAVEQGYGIRPAEIARLTTKAQNSGAY